MNEIVMFHKELGMCMLYCTVSTMDLLLQGNCYFVKDSSKRVRQGSFYSIMFLVSHLHCNCLGVNLLVTNTLY